DQAEVNAVHREVPHAGRPERAAVADSPGENPPGERQLIPVSPDRPGDLEIVIWFYVSDSVRRQAHPAFRIPSSHGLCPCVGEGISYNRLAKIKPDKNSPLEVADETLRFRQAT